jgi:RHS repeat-associated protein
VDPEGLLWSWGAASAGAIIGGIGGTDRSGKVIQYSYDAAKRLTIESFADEQISYTYDKLGRVTGRSNAGGQITYTYDTLGRLLSENQNGEGVEYDYTVDGELSTVTAQEWLVSYSRDAAGRVIGVDHPSGAMTYTLNKRGDRTRRSGLSSSQVDYTLTPAGWLTGMQYTGSTSLNYQYQHDAVGRITEWQGDGEGRSYQYDQASRLTRVSHAGGAQENYGYDGLSNRTNNQAQYDAANRLLEDADNRYTYDLSGNLTQKVSKTTGQKEVYQYNARNLLVAYRRYASETAPEPELQASYTYDALSRRTSKTVDGITTEFVWAGGTMIAEKQGTTIRRYFYDGLTPMLMEEGGQTWQYQSDHLATPRQMTDAQGNVVWAARLDAYGKVISETGTVENNLRFPGQYHDRETGLYYNWHRYYSPELGRYITSDPIGLEGGLNTYAYVHNNPINFSDFLGLMPPTDNAGYAVTQNAIRQAEAMWHPYQFRDKVDNGGVWDFKKQAPTGQSWENYGNYVYGATGVATGMFTLETLQREAGKNQCRSGNSDPSWGTPASGFPYGDDMNDQYWIMQGAVDYYFGYYGQPKSSSSITTWATTEYSVWDANRNFATPNDFWYRNNSNYSGQPGLP